MCVLCKYYVHVRLCVIACAGVFFLSEYCVHVRLVRLCVSACVCVCVFRNHYCVHVRLYGLYECGFVRVRVGGGVYDGCVCVCVCVCVYVLFTLQWTE